jgi:CRISPR-associated protein Cmr6
MTGPTTIIRAAGPLGTVLTTDRAQLHGATPYPLRAGANPLILLHRLAFVDASGAFDDKAERCLLNWAAEHDLGQDPRLIRLAAERRDRAIAAWRDSDRHRRIMVRPMWRLAVGLGNRTNPYEIGLSLHGTYGWPVIPGSTIKGVTCAWATNDPTTAADPATFNAVFGLPRVGEADSGPACEGTVTFLDALPFGGPVTVARDVVTPHVQPYYRDNPQPPAEYHNPIPAEFLVVTGGVFAIDLLGPTDQVEQAARWCEPAVDDLGVGGKTSSGYGYLTAERAQ